MVKGISVNVASSSRYPNGRGAIDLEDNSFDYLPIPEDKECVEEVPIYSDLDLVHEGGLKEPDSKVHLDPEFENYTYGHVKRGFGDMKLLLDLERNDHLFFHSTLANEADASEWLTAIIGYFEIEKIVDCRELSSSEIKQMDRFENNAHLKRKNTNVDFLLSGTENSRLFRKCIPLSSLEKSRSLKDEFKELIRTPKGKKINDGSPWFRWTLKVREPEKILEMR